MSSSSVYDTIKNHLVTQWSATYPVRDWEEIETVLQQETAPWLCLEDGSGGQDVKSIGSPSSNHVEDRVLMVIHILTPSAQSMSVARSIGDSLRGDLQFRYFTHSETERLRIVTVDPPAPGLINDGLWSSMILAVDVEHRYVVATAAE